MKLSTNTEYHFSLTGDDAKAIKYISTSADFEAIDYSMNAHIGFDQAMKGQLTPFFNRPKQEILDYYKNLGEYVEDCGLTVGQVHAPFPIYSGNQSTDQTLFWLSELSIEACQQLNCKYDVIHPAFTDKRNYDGFKAETKKINMDIFSRLIPTAQKCGVKIAIENMWGWDDRLKKICPTVCSTAEEMIEFIDELNQIAGEKLFVACLDIGHCNLTGQKPYEMIEKLGSRIEVLHVHDNDGVDDLHTLPFLGNIDWDKTLKALKNIGYKGNFSFEAPGFFSRFGDDLREEAARFMCDVGYALTQKYDL